MSGLIVRHWHDGFPITRPRSTSADASRSATSGDSPKKAAASAIVMKMT